MIQVLHFVVDCIFQFPRTGLSKTSLLGLISVTIGSIFWEQSSVVPWLSLLQLPIVSGNGPESTLAVVSEQIHLNLIKRSNAIFCPTVVLREFLCHSTFNILLHLSNIIFLDSRRICVPSLIVPGMILKTILVDDFELYFIPQSCDFQRTKKISVLRLNYLLFSTSREKNERIKFSKMR